jgi:hypothetical protein
MASPKDLVNARLTRKTDPAPSLPPPPVYASPTSAARFDADASDGDDAVDGGDHNADTHSEPGAHPLRRRRRRRKRGSLVTSPGMLAFSVAPRPGFLAGGDGGGEQSSGGHASQPPGTDETFPGLGELQPSVLSEIDAAPQAQSAAPVRVHSMFSIGDRVAPAAAPSVPPSAPAVHEPAVRLSVIHAVEQATAPIPVADSEPILHSVTLQEISPAPSPTAGPTPEPAHVAPRAVTRASQASMEPSVPATVSTSAVSAPKPVSDAQRSAAPSGLAPHASSSGPAETAASKHDKLPMTGAAPMLRAAAAISVIVIVIALGFRWFGPSKHGGTETADKPQSKPSVAQLPPSAAPAPEPSAPEPTAPQAQPEPAAPDNTALAVPTEVAAPIAQAPSAVDPSTAIPAAAPAPEPAEQAPNAGEATPAPLDTEAIVAQARALEKAGKNRQAITLYEQAAALDPNAGAILSHLAFSYLNRGDNKPASDYAARAVAVDPTNSEGWIVLGAARATLGDGPGARDAYKKCVEFGKGEYVAECKRVAR